MRRIKTEIQLYTQLAHRGDPTAFYALFHEPVRSLYVLSRSRGRDHEAACAEASKTLGRMYRRFVRRPPAHPEKWFIAGCKLRRFDAGAAGIAVSITEAEGYEKFISAELHRFYSERLGRGSDGKGNFKSERPWIPYVAILAVLAALTGFLFVSKADFSVSFGRFDKEYRASFPQMAEDLWKMSGLIRSGDESQDRASLNSGTPAEPADTELSDSDE
jgi:hypothetical protein